MSSRALLMREWTAMPLVLVISSFVAASRVGGGIAPYVLGPMKVDHVHVPTCLFGRHPGWGTPGGAPVEAEVMAGMLEGVEANGLFSLVDAVVTGHFSRPEQVKVAVEALIGRGFLAESDLESQLKQAGERWDWIIAEAAE